MGLYSVLDIAKTALLASQKAVQTTSHNIANVNTPGYTRQRVNLSAGKPVLEGGFYIGTGVAVEDVERIYDRFLDLQIFDASGSVGRYTTMEETLNRLEGIFNDSQGLGLSDALNNFFAALQDVANDPSSYSARTVLLGRAQTLSDRITNMDSMISQEINNLESQVEGEVDEINSLASRIASLNGEIQNLEAANQQANDLRDERYTLIKDLAQKIDITLLENDESQVDILVSGGYSLVAGRYATSMTVTPDPDNNNYYRIKVGNHDITSKISSGKLKGLLDARDINYQDALNRLENLAASLTKEFNDIHEDGYGLDGSTGNDLFTPLSVTSTSLSTNQGGASVTSDSIYNISLLTLDDYEIRFTGTSTFDIVNVTEGTTVSSGNSYTSGSNIDFEGIRVVITDGSGTPRSGDVFRVSVTKDAAQNFDVSLTDPNKFAAAKDSLMLPGDNTNVLDMVALESTKVLSNGSVTFSDFYSSLVSDIGMESEEASTNSNAQTVIMNGLEDYRNSVSGVSLEEEAANLLKYQHAYEAAAKVLTTVDSLLETLINLR